MRVIVVGAGNQGGKRAKVADACQDYGMDRIQYSAFLGPLLPTHQEELMMKIKKILGRRPGNVQLFPLCETDWQNRRVVVQRAAGEVGISGEAESENGDAG